MTVAVVLLVGLASATVGGMLWLAGVAINAVRAAADKRVEAAELRGENAVLTAALDTEGRMRRAEAARADALEEELADADQAVLAHPDAGARRRVLARWREANARTADAGGDRAGPVSDPSEADAAR